MTSSLVGSEMCIRDSIMTKLGIVQQGIVWTIRRAQYGLKESPRRWQEAVSYTHLTLPTICSV
eukprot:1994449-Prorocentrum_lima.AAC.1